MIPTIWLINIMLIHHWYMDNWPAWRKAAPVAAPAPATRRPSMLGEPAGSAAD